MNKYQLKHTITLTGGEEKLLDGIIKKGKSSARAITRARILRMSATGAIDKDIATRTEVSERTVRNVRRRFAEKGVDRALYDAPRPGQPGKLTDEGEAHLVAIACSNPPEGRTHWTLELLRDRMIADGKAPEEITTVTLWNRLEERGIKPWREKNVVHPET